MTDKVKKVSKKKIIFVQIDEEITSIFERISDVPYKDIYLVVPKRAILLQSVVNLKILKQKLEDIEKTVAVITNDSNGMKLAHHAGIQVFDHFDLRKDKSDKKAAKEDTAALLKPINATSNELNDNTPSRLPKKKSSIFEVVRDLRGRENGFSLKAYLKDKKENKLNRESLNLYLPAGVKKLLTGLLVASILVFGFIAYIVLPGATLYIEPASEVITKSVNVTLTPNPNDPRELKTYDVESTVELTLSHPASGIVSEGSDASGVVTIINEQELDQPLIEQTRLQTDDGVIFRLQDGVTVPASSGGTPGTIDVNVVADILDVNGAAVGARGNIGPTRFLIPGLREDTQSLVYGESYGDMTGGETVVSALVTEDDLIAAREKLEAQLKEKALASLRKEVLAEGNQYGIELTLLEDSDIIIYGTAIVDMPYESVNQEMESFEVSGSMSIDGVSYDKDALLAILKSEIMNAQTPSKQLVRIDEDTVSIKVIEFDNNALIYKFTGSIQGIEEYEIDPDLEGGSSLSKKIKEHIAGLSIEEAENYIQNLPEVNKVEIKIWPVWSPTIPTLPENIKIKSLSNEDAIELEE
ncbi:MAG: hypothetical protein ACI9QC_000947 [Oceanicoccus sp.]|jgi:hypothetical protein